MLAIIIRLSAPKESSETKRNTLSKNRNICLDANDYHERALLSIEQRIESMRIKIQSDPQNWTQRSNKFHHVGEYWQKLKKLDKRKYRLSSERSVHLSAG